MLAPTQHTFNCAWRLQHEQGFAFILMGKRVQRSSLSPKHQAAPEPASRLQALCFPQGYRAGNACWVQRETASPLLSTGHLLFLSLLTSSVRGVSGRVSFLQQTLFPNSRDKCKLYLKKQQGKKNPTRPSSQGLCCISKPPPSQPWGTCGRTGDTQNVPKPTQEQTAILPSLIQ